MFQSVWWMIVLYLAGDWWRGVMLATRCVEENIKKARKDMVALVFSKGVLVQIT
jgi:hypothetical protein